MFISSECQIKGISKAPINTSIYETYSQCNEDLIVEGVLRALSRRSGRDMSSVRYIEIGANHPIQTSATYLLSRLYGATGVLVEPIPALAETLRLVRPNDQIVSAVITATDVPFIQLHVHEKNELSSINIEHIDRFKGFGGREGVIETIQCTNLHINDFMKQYGSGQIDFMSIDVEGLDVELVRLMDPVFQPTLIQCEHEGRFDQFIRVMEEKNYGLLAVTDVNMIFLRRGIF
jgi:hypothetical protein